MLTKVSAWSKSRPSTYPCGGGGGGGRGNKKLNVYNSRLKWKTIEKIQNIKKKKVNQQRKNLQEVKEFFFVFYSIIYHNFSLTIASPGFLMD